MKTDVSIPLGTINTRYKNRRSYHYDVSIPLGTINTDISFLTEYFAEVSIPLGTINTFGDFAAGEALDFSFNSTRYN